MYGNIDDMRCYVEFKVEIGNVKDFIFFVMYGYVCF